MCLLYVLIFLVSEVSSVKFSEAVDLSWGFDENTVYWPTTKPFTFTKRLAEVRTVGWYAANEFCAGEHGGTHFDAPYHFNRHGWKVGEVPLTRLFGPGIVVNVSDEVEKLGRNALLLPKHLEEWEFQNGRIPKNSILLIYFGWSKYYNNKTEYLGIDLYGDMNFPGVSGEAADWIVQSGRIMGVGLDTASIDPGAVTNSAARAHRILSQNQIYILENVKIPSGFPASNFDLYVLPMKIMEGTGAPVRIVAMPQQSKGHSPWYGNAAVFLASLILLGIYVSNIIIQEH